MPSPARLHRAARRRFHVATNTGRPRWALRASAALTLGFLGSLVGTSAQAAPPAATTPQGDEIAHTVQEGDTLEGLAKAYLAAPRQWPLLQARNKVANPRRLVPGSVVWIPVRLHPAESATVEFVHGTVTAQARAGDAPAPVTQGGKLEEGTALQVGPDAFVSVKLADGTVVRVQAQSELLLRQLRRRGRAGSLQSVLEMRSGAVESSVPPNLALRWANRARPPHRCLAARWPYSPANKKPLAHPIRLRQPPRCWLRGKGWQWRPMAAWAHPARCWWRPTHRASLPCSAMRAFWPSTCHHCRAPRATRPRWRRTPTSPRCCATAVLPTASCAGKPWKTGATTCRCAPWTTRASPVCLPCSLLWSRRAPCPRCPSNRRPARCWPAARASCGARRCPVWPGPACRWPAMHSSPSPCWTSNASPNAACR